MQHNFRGTISVVCADNLASWSLGGYKALASALRKCRFCMAIAEDMGSKVSVTLYMHRLIIICIFSFFLMNLSLVLVSFMLIIVQILVVHYVSMLLRHMVLLVTLY